MADQKPHKGASAMIPRPNVDDNPGQQSRTDDKKRSMNSVARGTVAILVVMKINHNERMVPAMFVICITVF
jgi:hypothetical protein